MKNPGIYIIESTVNNRYYIGSTENMEKRLREHNGGHVKSTALTRPWLLRKFINCLSIKEARQSEYRLKKYKSRKIVENVLKSGILPWQFNKD